MIYDFSTCTGTGIFDMFNCLVVLSNFVLLYVLLIVVFLVVYGVFANSERSVKNNLLLSSTITALTALGLLMVAASSGYAASVITAYSDAAMLASIIAFVALLYHILGDL